MLITYESHGRRSLSDEEKRQLEVAKSMPIVFDEDCPPLTEEELSRFRRAHEKKIAN